MAAMSLKFHNKSVGCTPLLLAANAPVAVVSFLKAQLPAFYNHGDSHSCDSSTGASAHGETEAPLPLALHSVPITRITMPPSQNSLEGVSLPPMDATRTAAVFSPQPQQHPIASTLHWVTAFGFPRGREADIRAYLEAAAGCVALDARVSLAGSKLHVGFADAAAASAALGQDESELAFPGSILGVRPSKETVRGTDPHASLLCRIAWFDYVLFACVCSLVR